MFKKLVIRGLLLTLALFTQIEGSAKLHQLADATVYLKDGTIKQYDGTMKLSMPYTYDALQIVENAYTKKQKKAAKIPSATVDSVVTWLPTRPNNRHTFVYLPKYGWSKLLDRTAQSTAYMYAYDGYRISPAGGLWFYDTQKLILDRNEKRSSMTNPYSMNPEEFAKKLAKISGGDTILEARLKYLLGKEHPANYVRIVKMNGDTIYGYFHSEDLKTKFKTAFSKAPSLMQYINFSEEPDGKITRYSADEVSEMHFFYNNMALNTRVSMSMYTPHIFKREDYARGFPWLWDRRPSGSIVKWEVWQDNGGLTASRHLVSAVNVYFEGAKGAIMIYCNGVVNLYPLFGYMKDKAPEFHDMLKEYYYKCPDKKAHRKELLDNPSTILLLYEEYLKTHDYIDDRPDLKE